MHNHQSVSKRLREFASTLGEMPPSSALSVDGAPSGEVLDYCNQHHLTLDWVFKGCAPQFRKSAKQSETNQEDSQ
jgi:hypothetical protein